MLTENVIHDNIRRARPLNFGSFFDHRIKRGHFRFIAIRQKLCFKGKQWQEALRLFNGMKKNGITPDVITYSATISACEKGGQWQEAL